MNNSDSSSNDGLMYNQFQRRYKISLKRFMKLSSLKNQDLEANKS